MVNDLILHLPGILFELYKIESLPVTASQHDLLKGGVDGLSLLLHVLLCLEILTVGTLRYP